LASIIAGGTAAMIYDRFNSWDAVFYGSAALALFGCICAVVLKYQPLPRKASLGVRAVASTSPAASD
jgi:hypothetical protein